MRRFALFHHEIIYYFILPFMMAILPAIFHYGNNSKLALISSLGMLLIFLIGVAIIAYGLCLFFFKGRALNAAIATSIFLIFFHTYGIVFDQLRHWDLFRIEHFMLVPIFILLAIYLSWLVNQIEVTRLRNPWKITSVVVIVLAIFNLTKILPVEINKLLSVHKQPTTAISSQISGNNSAYPDIYYIIFDEMAGFNPIRQYWKYYEIDEFIANMESKGFYIAQNSRSGTANTFHEIANRLNYENYPYDQSDYRKFNDKDLEHISKNKVMAYLKSLGYTTVVFDEGLPLSTQYIADVAYTSSLNEVMAWGSTFDEFSMMVLNNTMFEPFTGNLTARNTEATNHERMMEFTAEQGSSLDITSPKFVFIHLLIPHLPFLFDADGHRVELTRQSDWDQYLGYYIYATHFAENMIDKILSSATVDHPPVIVFQSDHGARNIRTESGNILLENYPSEYQTQIVNMLYLPGCDDAPLNQDMDPVNTFPIIFNCYFDSNIPSQ